jgi:hypothetical protein
MMRLHECKEALLLPNAVRPKRGVKRSRNALEQSWVQIPQCTAGPKPMMMRLHQRNEPLLPILLLI